MDQQVSKLPPIASMFSYSEQTQHFMSDWQERPFFQQQYPFRHQEHPSLKQNAHLSTDQKHPDIIKINQDKHCMHQLLKSLLRESKLIIGMEHSQSCKKVPSIFLLKAIVIEIAWECFGKAGRERMIYVIMRNYFKQLSEMKQHQLLLRKQKAQDVFRSPSLSDFRIQILQIEVTRSFSNLFCLRLHPVEIDQRFLAHLHNLKSKSCVFSFASDLDFPAANDEVEQVSFNISEFERGKFCKGGLNADGQGCLFGFHLAVPVILDGIVGASRQKAGNGGPSVSEGKDPKHQNPFFVIAPFQLHHPFPQVIVPPLTTLLAPSIGETQSDA